MYVGDGTIIGWAILCELTCNGWQRAECAQKDRLDAEDVDISALRKNISLS